MNATRPFQKRNLDSRDVVEGAIEDSKDGWVRTWDAAQHKTSKGARRRQQDPKKKK